MDFNAKKIVVVTCLTVIVAFIIFIEYTSRAVPKDTIETNNANKTRLPSLTRRLRSVVDRPTDLLADKSEKRRVLSEKSKRYIMAHSANVQEFNSKQLDQLYARLGFR